MLDIIKHYLKDEDYFISIYRNYIYFYKYIEIVKFTDTLISLKFDRFMINISGTNLCVKKMEKKELLVSGNILNVEKIYV